MSVLLRPTATVTKALAKDLAIVRDQAECGQSKHTRALPRMQQRRERRATHQYDSSDGGPIRQRHGVGASCNSKDDSHSNLRCKAQAGSSDQQGSASNSVHNEDCDDGSNQLNSVDNDSRNQ